MVANHARSGSLDLEHLTAEELDLTSAVNTGATLLLVKAFAEQHDDARAGGRVVLFTSGQYHGGMPGEHAAVAAANPGGRWGRPDDTARLVGWLLSDESAWVTGQAIASDGGWSSR